MTCTAALALIADNTGWFILLAVLAPFVTAGIAAAWYELRYRLALRQERKYFSGMSRVMK